MCDALSSTLIGCRLVNMHIKATTLYTESRISYGVK